MTPEERKAYMKHYMRAYRNNNEDYVEKGRFNSRSYHCAHKEEKKSSNRAYKKAHKEKIRDNNKTYYESHKEELKSYYRDYGKLKVATCKDGYIEQLLFNESNIKRPDILSIDIEEKRELLIYKREIKSLTKKLQDHGKEIES